MCLDDDAHEVSPISITIRHHRAVRIKLDLMTGQDGNNGMHRNVCNDIATILLY